jgi:hypothetical protein
MTIDETLVVTGTKGADEAQEPYSAAWWEIRTAAELRDIIKRGFSGGQAFSGAVAESERRAREMTKRMREAAALEAEGRRKRRKVVTLGTMAATVIAIAASAGMWLR